MLKKIVLKNCASYGENGSHLETNKAINLIYGLNESGKTTIANYLSNQENKDFKDCTCDFSDNKDPPKIYVYNENFIEKNFREGDGNLKGVFSLSENSIETNDSIRKIEEENKTLEESKKIKTVNVKRKRKN